MLIALCTTIFAESGFANTSTPPTVPHGTCTTDPQFQTVIPQGGQGIISLLVVNIKAILDQVAQTMFTTITSDSGFTETMRALATLYIVFYGMMFAVGMVQITLFDFVIRMVKIGIIVMLASNAAWSTFNTVVVQFFNDGTDDWINSISSAVSGVALPTTAPPFYVVDQVLLQLVSAKTAVTLMAMFFTPPYGPIFGLLLVLGMSTLLSAIMTAARVYIMAQILKALLFGLAPIFLSFLLFVRTRYLFEGWLNQVVNATLQPILLFTFLAFFIELIKVALMNIFNTPVCWTEWSESVRGSPFSIHYWRYALCDGGSCEPFAGKWGFDGPQKTAAAGTNYPVFPIDIMGILVLVVLADLCARFNQIVIAIASDLAGASVSLGGVPGALRDWFSKTQAGDQTKGGGQGGGELPYQRGNEVEKARKQAAPGVDKRTRAPGGTSNQTPGNNTPPAGRP